MKFITHKSTFGKFPLKMKVSLRRNNIYLLPQAWGNWNSATHLHRTDDFYVHYNFLYPCEFQFSWLWLDIVWTTRIKEESTSKVVHSEYRERDTRKDFELN